jgi:hypothetical protein
MIPEQIAEQLKARNDKIEYRVFMTINIIILLAILALAVAFIVHVFKAQWGMAAGFGIITYIIWRSWRS